MWVAVNRLTVAVLTRTSTIPLRDTMFFHKARIMLMLLKKYLRFVGSRCAGSTYVMIFFYIEQVSLNDRNIRFPII